MKANELNGQPNKIEASTRITGEITSNADFRIDGYLNGSITTSGKVVIGKEGVIEGNIKCVNADIEGKFSGKIEASEILNLKSTTLSSALDGFWKLAAPVFIPGTATAPPLRYCGHFLPDSCRKTTTATCSAVPAFPWTMAAPCCWEAAHSPQ